MPRTTGASATEISHREEPTFSNPDAIRFEANDVASVRVEVVRPGSATIPTSAPAPSIPPGIALALELRRRLEPRLDDLRAGADWEHANDPAEALRRARVATRRLRCFAQLFEPVIGRERAKPLRKRLRNIARGIGPLRDWDALLSQLRAEHARAEPLGQAALEHVMAWATAQRESELPDARKAICEGDLPRLAEELRLELERVLGRVICLDDRLEGEVEQWLEPVLERTFGQMPMLEPDAGLEMLHGVRIRAKRLRYSVELVKPVLDRARYRELRRPAKQTQQLLGDHRDRARLANIIAARSRVIREQGLWTLAAALEPFAESPSMPLPHDHVDALRATTSSSRALPPQEALLE